MKITYKPLREFSSVKVDDKVFVQHGGGVTAYKAVETVIRLTKTQLICENKYGKQQRYRIKDGKQVAAEQGKWGWLHHSYIIGVCVETHILETPTVETNARKDIL